MSPSGAGIEHSELAQLAAPLLQDVPQGAPSRAPASKYVGGDFRTPQASAESHALLAFEVGFAGQANTHREEIVDGQTPLAREPRAAGLRGGVRVYPKL